MSAAQGWPRGVLELERRQSAESRRVGGDSTQKEIEVFEFSKHFEQDAIAKVPKLGTPSQRRLRVEAESADELIDARFEHVSIRKGDVPGSHEKFGNRRRSCSGIDNIKIVDELARSYTWRMIQERGVIPAVEQRFGHNSPRAAVGQGQGRNPLSDGFQGHVPERLAHDALTIEAKLFPAELLKCRLSVFIFGIQLHGFLIILNRQVPLTRRRIRLAQAVIRIPRVWKELDVDA